MKCLICDKEFLMLGKHLSVHKITCKEYYDRFLKKEKEGICYCGNETKFYRDLKNGYRKTCSTKCSNRLIFGSDTESKKKMINTNKKSLKKFWKENKIKKEQQSKRMKKRFVDNPELKTLATERLLKSMAENPHKHFNNKKNYKEGWFNSKKNSIKIYYQSSYELEAFKKLEKDKSVVSYNRNKTYIDYINPEDNNVHKYLPDVRADFKDGSFKIIEVKPSNLCDMAINKAKHIAAKELYNENFVIWTEKDLNITKGNKYVQP